MFSFCLGVIPNAYALNVYDNDSQKLDVLGRVEAGVFNKAAREEDKSAIEGKARLGINAHSKVNEVVSVIAFAEWDVSSATSEGNKFKTRYAYTGFDMSQYGVLVFGQGDTAAYQTVGFTDVFENWGNEANSYWSLGGRQEGQVAYVNAVAGYTWSVSYQTHVHDMGWFYNHDTGDKSNVNVNHGVATSLSYNWQRNSALDGLAFSVAYDYYSLGDKYFSKKRAFYAGLSYGEQSEGLYLGLNYNRTNISYESHHLTGFDAVAGYKFANGLGFMSGYGYYAYKLNKIDKQYLNLQVSYDFNDYFKVYTEAKFGIGHKDFEVKDRTQSDFFAISAQYNF